MPGYATPGSSTPSQAPLPTGRRALPRADDRPPPGWRGQPRAGRPPRRGPVGCATSPRSWPTVQTQGRSGVQELAGLRRETERGSPVDHPGGEAWATWCDTAAGPADRVVDLRAPRASPAVVTPGTGRSPPSSDGDGHLRSTNTPGGRMPWLQVLTWVFQVVPCSSSWAAPACLARAAAGATSAPSWPGPSVCARRSDSRDRHGPARSRRRVGICAWPPALTRIACSLVPRRLPARGAVRGRRRLPPRCQRGAWPGRAIAPPHPPRWRQGSRWRTTWRCSSSAGATGFLTPTGAAPSPRQTAWSASGALGAPGGAHQRRAVPHLDDRPARPAPLSNVSPPTGGDPRARRGSGLAPAGGPADVPMAPAAAGVAGDRRRQPGGPDHVPVAPHRADRRRLGPVGLGVPVVEAGHGRLVGYERPLWLGAACVVLGVVILALSPVGAAAPPAASRRLPLRGRRRWPPSSAWPAWPWRVRPRSGPVRAACSASASARRGGGPARRRLARRGPARS